MRKNRADGSRSAVCLCCDGPFLPIALFLADQMHRAAPGRKHDICLCSTEDLHLPAPFADGRFRVIRVDPGAVFATLDAGVLSRATYLRLWLGDVLAQDYARILYLDSDMFLEGADPGSLFGLDLGGRAVGAVRDMQQWRHPERLVSEFAAMEKKALPYFNAGLLLIDTALYGAESIRQQALALAQERPDLLHHHDQSLLNAVLLGNFAEISPVWNWQWVGTRPYLGTLMRPQIVHFVGHDKPWNDRKGMFPPHYRAAYRLFLDQHFPECALMKPARRPTVRKQAQMLYQSMIGYPALRRMQSRFPDPLATAR